jgi:chaperonin GroES
VSLEKTPDEGGLVMKIQPLSDRVVVLRIGEEEKTAGGIIIPDTAKEKPQEGKVVAVGPGKVGEDGKRIPMDVKKGNRILFGKYAGTEIEIDGVEHLIMREEDILGIIEK